MEKTANDILMELKAALSLLKKEVESLEDQVVALEEAMAAGREPEEAAASLPEDMPAFEEPEMPVSEPLPEVPEEPVQQEQQPEPEQPSAEEPVMALDLPEEEEAIDLGISDFSTGDFAEDFKAPNINDQEASNVKTAVMDVMAEKCAWKTDIPGSPVKNVLSGISLNDRILIVKTLFNEDASVFQQTIQAFNSFTSLAEAEDYVMSRFPNWDMNSDVVYRFMMAARRKLR